MIGAKSAVAAAVIAIAWSAVSMFCWTAYSEGDSPFSWIMIVEAWHNVAQPVFIASLLGGIAVGISVKQGEAKRTE